MTRFFSHIADLDPVTFRHPVIWRHVLIAWLMFSLSACSWEGIAHGAGELPGQLRLVHDSGAENVMRWRLSPDSHVRVISADAAPSNWVASAQRGMDRAFPDVNGVQGFQLVVSWPEEVHQTQDNHEHEVVVGLFGLSRLPRISSVIVLDLQLLDPLGGLVHATRMKIDPPLLGKDWSTEEVLDRSFYDLALSFRGS